MASVMTKKECGKIQSGEMQFLRNTLNYTSQDRMRNEDIRAELEVKDINEMIFQFTEDKGGVICKG